MMIPPIGSTRWSAILGSTITLVLLAGAAHPSPRGAADDLRIETAIRIPVAGGFAAIDPTTLAVVFSPTDGEPVVWSAPSPTELGRPTAPTANDGVISWGYGGSDLRVSVSEQDGRLDTELASPTDRSIVWPVTATDAGATSIEFPNGEGQSIPVDDPFWLSDESHLTGDPWDVSENLTMPFWGTTLDGSGVGYSIQGDTDIGTRLSFAPTDGRLTASATHAFSGAADTSTFRLAMAATDGNPIASAQDYREQLISRGGITTLEEKIAANPETAKLIGALHAYVWGDGDDPTLFARMRELGIDAAWVGYNIDVAAMSPETVAAANAAGYLVGPYDTWENAQDPTASDSLTSVWPGTIWPDACARDENGDPLEGFGGRGCTLGSSAMAVEEATNGVLTSRVRDLTSNGVTSYFLDVDTTGSMSQDFSPAHPQTKAEDRANRIARMGALTSGGFSDGRRLVLGSEKAEAWANPVIDFSHGSSTPISNGVWMLQKDKEQWGGYWPADRPGFFFTPVKASDALAKEMFDPRYRVPLYEAVLHDSVVSTDRWEMGLYKFAGLESTRILTNLLYNTPAMVSLDQQVLSEHGEQLAGMQQFFGLLQDAAGTSAMTSFERVGASVQRTTFGDDPSAPKLTVAVNFGTNDTPDARAGCAAATTPGQAPVEYCP